MSCLGTTTAPKEDLVSAKVGRQAVIQVELSSTHSSTVLRAFGICSGVVLPPNTNSFSCPQSEAQVRIVAAWKKDLGAAISPSEVMRLLTRSKTSVLLRFSRRFLLPAMMTFWPILAHPGLKFLYVFRSGQRAPPSWPFGNQTGALPLTKNYEQNGH